MPYTQTTRAQLRAALREQLGPSAFWRDDELNTYLNEALRVFNLLTGFWRGRSANIPTVVDQVFYAVPGTHVSCQRILFNNKPLQIGSLFDLDMARLNWQSETTTSGGEVPTEPKIWCPVGLTRFAIWPADAAGGNSLLIDGIIVAPVLSSDPDLVDIGDEEQDIIINYGQHLATFKSAGGEFADTQQQFKDFLKGAIDRNAMLAHSSKFKEWAGLAKDEQTRPLRQEVERPGAR